MLTFTVDGVLGGVDIKDEVDTGVLQLLHALVVVLGVVDGVDTDGVDAQLLEQRDVALAVVRVSDRVRGVGRATLQSRLILVLALSF